jgi:hypothetical protein
MEIDFSALAGRGNALGRRLPSQHASAVIAAKPKFLPWRSHSG